jgi:protein phosphatase
VKVTAAASTDIGRVREGNEDAYLNEAPLFAVADGMGGHRGGEVASQLALETLEVLFRHRRGTLPDQVREANRAVFERSSRDAAVAGMGTTLTAAVADADRLRLAHVGDSRAYLLRDGELRMLTEDHTLVHRMVSQGEISDEEAEVHPHRSILTRALGTEPDIQVDESVLDAQDGDRILLCTDGLTGMVTDDEIERTLREAAEPKDAVKRLVRAANQAGGVDNITAVVLDLELEPHEKGGASGSARDPAGGQARGSGARARALRRRPHAARRIAFGLAATVLVFVVAGFGARYYLDQQWYVGVANSRVAVYRGIPSEVLGFRLHHVVVVTPLPAAEVVRLEFYRSLSQGISAEDHAGANAIVQQMTSDLQTAQAAEQRAREQARRQARRQRKQDQKKHHKAAA